MVASRSGTSPILYIAVAVFLVGAGAMFWLLLGGDDGGSGATDVLIHDAATFETGTDLLPPEPTPASPVENLATRPETPSALPLTRATLENSGSIEGIVFDGENKPMPGVEISLYKGNSNISGSLTALSKKLDGYEMVSDSEGRFFLPNVPVGQPYHVVGVHEDYARSETSGIRVRKDKVSGGVTLRMLLGAIISGTVVQRDSGNAIPGARIELYDTMINSRLKVEERKPWKVVFSDNQGQFAFAHISQPTIRVLVQADDFESQSRSAQSALEGRMRDRHLKFELGPGFSLNGQVVDDDGGPILDARVQATSLTKDFQGEALAFSDRSGFFQLEGLGEHHYMLRTMAEGYTNGQEPKVDFQDAGLVIVLQRQGAATGLVTKLDGSPMTRFSLHLMRAAKGRAATYLGDNRPFQAGDGRFVFDELDPGNYVLEARSKSYADTRSAAFTIERNAQSPHVDIRMGRGGTIGGVIRDGTGQPLAGALVEMNDNNQIDNAIARIFNQLAPPGKSVRQTRSNEKGVWKVSNVPPETYQISVTHNKWAPRRLNDVVVIDDDMGTNPPIDVTLPSGARVGGRAMDVAGMILPFCRVQISATGGFMKTTTTDNEGHFQFDNLEEGVYKITLNPEKDGNGVTLNPITMLVYSQRSAQEVALRQGQAVDDLTLYLRKK